MLSFVQQYAGELIAILAVLSAVVANSRAVRANKRAARAEYRTEEVARLARRTEILVENERKNSVAGRLAFITARKVRLLQNNPSLEVRFPGEKARLLNNLDLMEEWKHGEQYQRQLAEEVGGELNVSLHEQALADMQRLRIRLEGEVAKESEVFQAMQEEAEKYKA